MSFTGNEHDHHAPTQTRCQCVHGGDRLYRVAVWCWSVSHIHSTVNTDVVDKDGTLQATLKQLELKSFSILQHRTAAELARVRRTHPLCLHAPPLLPDLHHLVTNIAGYYLRSRLDGYCLVGSIFSLI